MESRQQKFLKNYSDEKISKISHDIYIYAPVTNTKEMQIPDWELRFSIFPDQDNLNKAAEVIANTLLDEKNIQHEFAFKMISFNKIKDGEKLNSWRALGAEGAYTTLDNISDRDQRGKEFCLYLRFHREMGKPEQSPQEWKKIILKMWKALHDAKIKMGYINPQIGDRELPCDTMTPVSYMHTQDRDWKSLTENFWKNVHEWKGAFDKSTTLTNWLYQMDWEESPKADPLAGVKITWEDLEKAGISYDSIFQMQKNKILYLEEHSRDSLAHFSNRMRQLPKITSATFSYEIRKDFLLNNLVSLESHIAKLADNLLAEEILSNIKDIIDEIVVAIPREDKYGVLTLPPPINELLYMHADFPKKKNQPGYFKGFLQRVQNAIQYVKETYTEDKLDAEYQRILNLYQQDKWIMTVIHELMNPSLFENLIANFPAVMELQYRHLREIKKEHIMLEEAINQFAAMPTVEEFQAFRKKVRVSVEMVDEIIRGLGFFDRLCGKSRYWLSLKDSIVQCGSEVELDKILKGMKDKRQNKRLLEQPKYHLCRGVQ